MKISVNGEQTSVEEAITVSDLLVVLHGPDTATRGVAVALNGQVVSRSRWGDTILKEGDRVEVLRAVGGGA